jgi:hypothetical protein
VRPDRLEAVGDDNTRWHMLMLAEPAVRVARAWLADEEQQRLAIDLDRYQRGEMLWQWAQREENIDVQVRTLAGCVDDATNPKTNTNVRLCCCHPDEWFYIARRVVRERATFVGVMDRWSVSMRLLEATLRMAYGAAPLGRAWQGWPGLRVLPDRAAPWYSHAWLRPPDVAPFDWQPPANNSWRSSLRSHVDNTGPFDTNPDTIWVSCRVSYMLCLVSCHV